ncbi:MAG: DUF2007 domain-containing protein [Alcanivorax sp.]|uniref:putative signal transducing protein n=1 Tax=Alcanivorax sp. TaxID=1872427 RepID=UPI003DA78221
MKCVFHARDGIEAHMLADLLDQVGIMAQVQGDMLQGAVGELPAAGLASVWVAESDESRAREVIAEFEASQPADIGQSVRPGAQRSFTRGLLLGMVIGAVVMLVLLR